MFSIGLTGGIGSGKSTVATLFAQREAAVVDADLIAHQLTAANGAAMPMIVARFGPAMATDDGALDRAAMRQHVFANDNARHALEEILHPMIRAQMKLAAATAWAGGAPYVVLAIPLLVEAGSWKERAQRVLVVDCTLQQQRERSQKRSGLSDDAMDCIIASQASREQRLAAADDIVVNTGAEADLGPRVDRLHACYCLLASAVRAASAAAQVQRV